jgi:shikimate 5-dehydrogenase
VLVLLAGEFKLELAMTHQAEMTMEANPELPYQRDKIPVSSGLDEFRAFVEQYPDFSVCPYVADKTDEGWNSSTSRAYMNQVLPKFLYVPVNVPKDDTQGLSDFFEAIRDDRRVPAVNITQPHKSSPVLRRIFLGDEASQDNVDTLIRTTDGELKPYDLNAPAFVGWYTDEVGSFTGKTVVLVGVGGVGEPMAKAIAKQSPSRLVLVDPNSKAELAGQLGQELPVSYSPTIGDVAEDELSGELVLINAAGKEGATDSSGVLELLTRFNNRQNVFVDIRPQLDIEVVESAKQLGWQSFTGYGMNARNDYTLLSGIAEYLGVEPLSFAEFQSLVAKAS